MSMLKDYQNYLESYRELAPGTVLKYMSAVRSFAVYINGNHRAGDGEILLSATIADIERYFIYLNRTKNLARNSRASWIKFGIKRFYHWAQKQGLTDLQFEQAEIVLKKSQRDKDNPVVVLKESDVQKIRAFLEEETPPVEIHALYNQMERHCAIVLMIETGARISEIVNLKPDDLKADERYIIYNGAKNVERHDTNGIRRFPLSGELIATIQATMDFYRYVWQKEPQRILHCSATTLRDYLCQVEAGAGLNIHLHPHLFRHYQITRLRDMRDGNGNRTFTDKQISTLFGVSIKVLERVYYHPDDDKTQAVYEKAMQTVEA
ncbi:MAG: tyrosine-type recombinase/integrase [Candidatus Marinimicrobia bacterium]|nr:tyrosine-type recombinase/integrase [Candidatus Neomarinimicrobiota bacterium]